ncbi:VOC family protein [Fodinicola feengrottensis]|uniref:VOC family protein n=1 Tax=Fodinicola feengrottensis TaxID=435914 RepID=A0ABP4USL7_9ACTN
MPAVDPDFDHLVYATADLAATVRRFAELTGITPAEGGRHVGRGTRNFLAGLGGRRYLEIIGPDPDQPTPDAPRPFGIDDLSTTALVTWAVRATDLEERVSKARTAGYDPGSIGLLSRRTPAGDLLQWRLTTPASGDRQGIVPFLIDWGTTTHPADANLPAVDLTSLIATHPDPAAAESRLAALGVTLPVRPGAEESLTATLQTPHGWVTLT